MKKKNMFEQREGSHILTKKSWEKLRKKSLGFRYSFMQLRRKLLRECGCD